MIGCCSGRKVRNGLQYTIVEIKEKITVQHGEDEPMQLKRGKFVRCMRLPHGITFASCQGLTVPGLIALWDCDHPCMTWRHLLVGLSRATARDKVVVMPGEKQVPQGPLPSLVQTDAVCPF